MPTLLTKARDNILTSSQTSFEAIHFAAGAFSSNNSGLGRSKSQHSPLLTLKQLSTYGSWQRIQWSTNVCLDGLHQNSEWFSAVRLSLYQVFLHWTTQHFSMQVCHAFLPVSKTPTDCYNLAFCRWDCFTNQQSKPRSNREESLWLFSAFSDQWTLPMKLKCSPFSTFCTETSQI